jgi:hypothetical protein
VATPAFLLLDIPGQDLTFPCRIFQSRYVH